MNNFMGGVFDQNGDNYTDAGEEFMAYQSYKETVEHDYKNKLARHVSSNTSETPKIKLWHIIVIILLIIWHLSCMTNPYNKYSGSSSHISDSQYKYSSPKRALTKEEADALRGTGYHNTRPNSSAENMELAAAQVKCKRCGMHSSNGLNSMCDSCRKITGGV